MCIYIYMYVYIAPHVCDCYVLTIVLHNYKHTKRSQMFNPFIPCILYIIHPQEYIVVENLLSQKINPHSKSIEFVEENFVVCTAYAGINELIVLNHILRRTTSQRKTLSRFRPTEVEEKSSPTLNQLAVTLRE